MHAAKTILFSYLISCVTANPITVAALRARQDAVAACQDLTSSTSSDGTTVTTTQFPDSSCWDTLDMTDWMTKWNATTTVCTATQSPSTSSCQCRIDESWATCFMRLTYARNKTASYMCTDLAKPENCTAPTPENVVPGPPEIFYGAYSIWSLYRYLAIWHKSLTTHTSMPAITTELSRTKTSALSANHLLAALIQDFAPDASIKQPFLSIVTTEPIVGEIYASDVPTLSNAQTLLAQVLQQVLDVVMSDWASGDFLTMAKGGTLLNGPVEGTNSLNTRLAEEKKSR